MVMNMDRYMGLLYVENVLRVLRKIVPHRKLAENLIRKIDPEKIAQVTVEKFEAEGICERLNSKIIDKTAARLGFERGSTERGVRASPHLAARTVPWVMLPPAFIQVQGQGGYYHLVCKFYSPSHGDVFTFYKTYQSIKTGLQATGVVIKDGSNMDWIFYGIRKWIWKEKVGKGPRGDVTILPTLVINNMLYRDMETMSAKRTMEDADRINLLTLLLAEYVACAGYEQKVGSRTLSGGGCATGPCRAGSQVHRRWLYSL